MSSKRFVEIDDEQINDLDKQIIKKTTTNVVKRSIKLFCNLFFVVVMVYYFP
jgi:predicted PurR-regulated permease PerM